MPETYGEGYVVGGEGPGGEKNTAMRFLQSALFYASHGTTCSSFCFRLKSKDLKKFLQKNSEFTTPEVSSQSQQLLFELEEEVQKYHKEAVPAVFLAWVEAQTTRSLLRKSSVMRFPAQLCRLG
ncbi:unnamed protein product [Caretta caretta]